MIIRPKTRTLANRAHRHLKRFALPLAVLLFTACSTAAETSTDAADDVSPYALCNCLGVMSATQIANAFHEDLMRVGDFDQQIPIVSKYLQLVDLDMANMPEDRLERLALGEGAYLTFQVAEADAFYTSVMEGDDLIAMHAYERMMQVTKRALGDDEKAWEMVQAYYQKFPPTEANFRGRNMQITNLANEYITADEPEKAVEIILDELNALPANAPYMSYGLLMRFNDTLQASPQKQQVRDLIAARVGALKSLQQSWRNSPALASDDPILRGDMPTWFWRTQYVRPGESLRGARTRQLEGLINNLDQWLADMP